METARMMFRPIAQTKFPSNQNDTDDLDDTLPIELLDCVNTTTNNDWLTRATPFPGKHSAPKVCTSESGASSLFNPPLSSTRYQSNGSSSEISDISTTAELGSTCCDDSEVLSAESPVHFFSPLPPAPSVEFPPLRCSNDGVLRVSDTFQIRVDTNEFETRGKEPEDRSESIVVFNTLRSSTGLVHECAVVKSRAVQRNESVEFNPLRCSTGLNEEATVKPKPKAVQRSESVEFNPLRCSTGLNEGAAVKPKPNAVQRNESVEFNPLRCSTRLVNKDAAVEPKASERLESIVVNPSSHSTGLKTEEVTENPVQISSATPDEFYVTACNTFTQNTVRVSDTHFVTALDYTQANNHTGGKSVEGVKSPTVQVSGSQLSSAQNKANVDNDLSILMECHLKIRNGRHIVSNLQAKPHIELSIFKNNSPTGTATTVVPKAFSTANQHDSDQSNKHWRTTYNGLNDKPTGGKVHLKSKQNDDTNFASPSAVPTATNVPGESNILRNKLIRRNPLSTLDGRQSPDIRSGNRVQRAMDNLASANIQKVISALAILDSAKSAPICETLVLRGLVDNVYDFLSKMNRSIAHQVACVHATSLLLDLAKYTYSRESVWQNGERIGLLFNLMFIWVSKDNAIFLNCATTLWVFSQDVTRANVLQHFTSSQNKLLEKISAKLGTKFQRPPTKVPTLQPSWTDLGTPRTYDSPSSAFSGLKAALQRLPRLERNNILF